MTKRGPRVAPVDAHIGYWLRFISNRVVHRFSERLANRGVTVAEWVVLRGLYDRVPVASGELADDLRLTHGAVSKLVDRLVAKKLVKKSEGEADRRYQWVTLTPSGRALVPDLAALAEENDHAFFEFLGDDGRAEFRTFLMEIARRNGMNCVEGSDRASPKKQD